MDVLAPSFARATPGGLLEYSRPVVLARWGARVAAIGGLKLAVDCL